jgi:hypothetical protein
MYMLIAIVIANYIFILFSHFVDSFTHAHFVMNRAHNYGGDWNILAGYLISKFQKKSHKSLNNRLENFQLFINKEWFE